MVAVLVAVAGTAQAKLDHRANFEVRPANTSAAVDLGQVGPYRIGLLMPSDRVAIFYLYGFKARKKEKLLASYISVYAVHSERSLTDGLIKARFGSLGSFSLRFQSNGKVRKDSPQRGCKGPPELIEPGRFVGRATFHGESNHLHFSRSVGKGAITHSSRLRCKKGETLDPTKGSLRAYVTPGSFFATRGDIALLYASSREHGRYIGVTAGHEAESPPGADLRVGVIESKGEMAIGRYAYVPGPAETLLTSLPGVHPATATLTPPAPFFGKATYQENPGDSPGWTGTLGVNLPGLKLPLAGTDFHVRLCVLRPLTTKDGCDFFKAEPASQFDERLARPGLRLR
jgi:hypothetical protein